MSDKFKLKVSFVVYACRDSHGNYDAALCEDPSDTIQICLMKDKNGKGIYFESEAYHLENWCEENGLEYTEKKGFYDIEV